jgi:protein-L-isoaspartate(D-aspartate) O-methyltransferase
LEEALRSIPRSNFVGRYIYDAYEDKPLPIPSKQTISAPHMYAMMLSNEVADLHQGMDILEIGTGSGYGAALLAYTVQPGRVVSIERHPELVNFAKENVQSFGLTNLTILEGDGTNPAVNGSFDRIICTAAGPIVPPIYYSLLKKGGIVIMPLEKRNEQWLVSIRYIDGKEEITWHFRVRFVPLIGRYGHSVR